MNHTPGPWKSSLFNIVTDVTGIIKEKPKPTPLKVDKGLLEILDDNESTVAFVNLEDTSLSKKDLANAILIAAAPLLLESLRDALCLLGSVQEYMTTNKITDKSFDSNYIKDVLGKGWNTIEKATGEQA